MPCASPHGNRRRKCALADAALPSAARDPGFLDVFDLTGDSLKRPPRGYDAGHPCLEDLKRKDYIASCWFDEEEATSPEFMEDFADACRAASAYMEFLTTAVGLPF